MPLPALGGVPIGFAVTDEVEQAARHAVAEL